MAGGRIPRAVLERFGGVRLRPQQRSAIASLLDGRDTLTLLPTAAGKSLTFQVASQLLPGATIVVEPLLALVRDQLRALAELGVPAAEITGRSGRRAVERALAGVRSGELRLVYSTPERLADAALCERLAAAGVSLLAVDEAHCISHWGHGFRPAYLGLADVARRLGRPTIEALTATATPFVRDDIERSLELRAPDVVAGGNDRPNLFLEVRPIHDESEDRTALLELLEAGELRGQGIVYARTTSGARETARWLAEAGHSASAYHGRMRKSERDAVQRSFTVGETRIVAATNAFGLGVDKQDVRWVVHRDVPASLEAYWQEAGRAGRDGRRARCTLLYRPGDLGSAAFQARAGGPDTAGRQERERGLLEMMRGYAETEGCRRRYVLNYLGEEYDPARCRMCDRSIDGASQGERPPAAAGLAHGARVRHRRFGDGVVQRVTERTVTVLFDGGAYRRLSLELALAGRLQPVEASA